MKNNRLVYYSIPWDSDKDLVSYYNDFMELLPDNSWACYVDRDAMFTTNTYGIQIEKYIELYPEYSCFAAITSRIGGLRLKINSGLEYIHDINKHFEYGVKVRDSKNVDTRHKHYELEDFTEPKPHHLSGFCFVLSKKAWKAIGGFKPWRGGKNRILGVDSQLHQDLYDNGFKVGIMKSVYLYHWYSGGQRNVKHLK